MVAALAAPSAGAALRTRLDISPGEIVDVPYFIPHALGAKVDSRIIDQLAYLQERYGIYIEEGWAGPLPGGGFAGCDGCHVNNSDHYRGLAVDIHPVNWDGKGCDSSWAPINRLAHRLEPRQNHPMFPFRFVGYNGDVDHGCGNHLHLSWTYAPTQKYEIARYIYAFVPPFVGVLTSG